MDYIESTVDAPYDIFASESDAAATRQRYQQALDTLYSLGCKYSITCEDMRPLCDHAGVAFDDLMKHNTSNTNTTKATPCPSQRSSSEIQALANQPAYATSIQQKHF